MEFAVAAGGAAATLGGLMLLVVRCLPLAALDWTRLGVTVATSVVIPVVLGCILRAAQTETRKKAGDRTAAYGTALRAFVILGWCFVGVLGFFGGSDGNFLKIVPLLLLFGGLIGVLHLEVFGALITWDSGYLYTRSAWRAPRTIPLSTIRRCDYSSALQWYRLYSRDHGIVRLHQFKRGIPELFAVLPCDTPPYPPTSGR